METKMLIVILFNLATYIQSGHAIVGNEESFEKNKNNEDNAKNCLCFEQSSPTVSNVFGTDGSDIERLVAYFYRNKKTGVTQLYTPKREIQLRFPELPVNSVDEVSVVSSEKIDEILTSNPNFINFQTTKPENQVTTDSVPVDADRVIVVESNLLLEPYPIQSHDKDQTTDNIILKAGTKQNLSAPGINEKSTEGYLNMPYLRMPDLQIFPEKSNDLEPQKVDTDSNNNKDIVGQISETVTENVAPKTRKKKQLKNSHYLTFDEWFDQQMNRIQKTGKSPNSNFDIASLKTQIEKSLYENNLYVTRDGVLIDANGAALDVENLKLRPILIGDSVSIQSILDASSPNFVLPPNLPYLEAILLSSVNPPSSLGVIPLGKTYVPRMSYRKNFNYNSIGNRQSKPRSFSIPNFMGEIFKMMNPDTIFAKKQNKPAVPVNSWPYKPSVPVNSWPYKPSVPVNSWPYKPAVPVNSWPYEPSVPVNSWPYKTAVPVNSWPYKPAVPIKSNRFGFNFGSELGFRIIGGNAATGSGTPVNNRGRSGFIKIQ